MRDLSKDLTTSKLNDMISIMACNGEGAEVRETQSEECTNSSWCMYTCRYMCAIIVADVP